ncbi:intraflagellar transport protein 20 homolog [Hetaerina americana]|uniref:intraflagellar transport protein 20 homolog n=1 Tax=Hetaerina americana TaxID=62018 RepID=UPI003A7F5156
MTDSLSKIGLYFDDLNKLRVVEPSVSLQSNQLKDECKAFIGNVSEFDKITGEVLNIVDDLAKELESEKMRALGLQNMLQSVSRTRELRREQLKDLIKENTWELERLKVQRQSLIKMEQERQDLIDKLVVER